MVRTILTTVLLAAAPAAVANQADPVEPPPEAPAAEQGPSVYLIGNSLTWDTVPSRLDGDVQWHVDCGKPLTYIQAKPTEPCVKTSTLWPAALEEKQYDIVSFQPHYGTTLKEDVEAIATWLNLQPDAVVVIHTGWARSAQRIEEMASTDVDGALTHSRDYFIELLRALRTRFPDREFRTTACMLLLETIVEDIADGDAPFDAVEELYRDAIHMNVHTGRYLMHNAMRQTLGQPRLQNWSEQLTREQQRYLDSVLDRHAEVQRQLMTPATAVAQ